MKLLKKQSIPNYLTFFRMILVPVYITLYCMQHYRLSGAVFLLAGITDVVDGYIARRNNWVTDIGKLLDPLADKLMCISAVTCLTWVGERDPHLDGNHGSPAASGAHACAAARTAKEKEGAA